MPEPRRSSTVVEKVAASVYLQAFNRLGVPLILAGVTYFAAQVVTLDRRMFLVEQTNADQTTRLVQVEARRDELIAAIGNLRADISAMRADQVALLRVITRLEGLADQRNGNGNGGAR